MVGKKRLFKKNLTNGGSSKEEAREVGYESWNGKELNGVGVSSTPPPGSLPLKPTDASLLSTASTVSPTLRSQSSLLRAIDSRDIPVSSLVAAESFTKVFLAWCATADITGPIDWPKLFELSQAYAVEEEIRPVSSMALAKSLTKLGVRKTLRPLKNGERPNRRLRGQSDAKNPRVTVYVLPAGDASSEDEELQLKLFE